MKWGFAFCVAAWLFGSENLGEIQLLDSPS